MEMHLLPSLPSPHGLSRFSSLASLSPFHAFPAIRAPQFSRARPLVFRPLTAHEPPHPLNHPRFALLAQTLPTPGFCSCPRAPTSADSPFRCAPAASGDWRRRSDARVWAHQAACADGAGGQAEGLAERNGGANGNDCSWAPPRLSVAPMMDWTDCHYRQLARLMSRHTWLYTEMVVDNTLLHQQPHLDRFLLSPRSQRPVVLQLGGSDPPSLAEATRLALPYAYDEINLNCGCPSPAVSGHGCFGARLMLSPKLVASICAAMGEVAGAAGVPVTVKCRIGVDDCDSYEQLHEFISTVSSFSPVRHFTIHARKALLKGLSPAQNRTVPPLRYEYVFALLRDFPSLSFTLNGGVTSLQQASVLLDKGVHGVMIGRAAYNTPWHILSTADVAIFGAHSNPLESRRELLHLYAQYSDSAINQFGPGRPNVRTLVKPLLGLFHCEPGAGKWRRLIDTEIRQAKTIDHLLSLTLHAFPPHVLDAPPSSFLSHPTSPSSPTLATPPPAPAPALSAGG
ncbi:hypothetical protein CLOP_g4649 [Closterium sp. NIES-67]|nr:hypothetical protein CLOP_g4649 [Closterium sp. NIES-67]